MKINFCFAIGLLLLIFSSCEEKVNVVIPEYHKIFTGNVKKTWKLTTIQWTGEGKDPLTYSLSSCYKDDLYTFYNNAEHLYEVTNGATKCDSSEPDTLVSDSWSFVNANSTLTIIFPLLSDSNLPFFVRRMTNKEMVFEIYLDQDSKYSYKMTMQSVSEE